MAEEDKHKEALMRASFEGEIQERLRRASSVRLQNIIPAHWFSAAASECARMYIAGFFYGAISVTQAYVEALSKYLAEHHKIRVGKDIAERCRRLRDRDVLSAPAFDAATKILNDRNDFHHLNKDVEQDFRKLEERAAECINLLHCLNQRSSRTPLPRKRRAKLCSRSRSIGHRQHLDKRTYICVSYGNHSRE